METRVMDIVSSLDTSVHDVRMIGINGTGGAGKTTLARAVYDQISYQFDGCSFVENVREESGPSMSGLKLLQKQILSDILTDQGITVSGVLEGKSMLKKKLRGRKVLIVLDDVDNIEQLAALVGERSWFMPGSRIIITTRYTQVLTAHKVNLIRDIALLSDKEAISLFSRHAFERNIPIYGNKKQLLRQVVHYAAGLPLKIIVLGSFLYGKDAFEWEDALKRLKTPFMETLEKLELCYNDLREDYNDLKKECKEMYVDAKAKYNDLKEEYIDIKEEIKETYVEAKATYNDLKEEYNDLKEECNDLKQLVEDWWDDL
ncbi:Toll/interleukin-1 receptor domain-containing protein [Tanacetum coccineum]